MTTINRRNAGIAIAAALAMGFGLAAGSAKAQDAASFFEGKTIKIIVGYGPGGGFDSYARMLAPHLEKSFGTTVIVENRPGGGGLSALNQLVRDSDGGAEIMLLHGEAAVLAQVVEKEGVTFDLTKVNFLGRVQSEPRVILVSANSPYRSLKDLLASDRPIKFAAGGRTDGIGDVTTTLCEGLGLNCQLITGYKGSKEASLAAISGEADAMTITESSSKSISQGGKMIPVGTLDQERGALFPDLPTVFEQVDLPDDKAWWIEFRSGIAKIGRTLVTGPDVPEDRVEYLREKIKAVLTDPAVMEEGAKTKRDVRYEAPAATVKFVKEVLGSLEGEQLAAVRHVLLEKY
ncbi:MAG: tripartite tricarboxylate transporter substrate-binding protein [Hyphomicrobiales bacterium]|nr:tripartite tricarboxylate transporter substrate-binding protein [Hyphomicrobiales bacterium]